MSHARREHRHRRSGAGCDRLTMDQSAPWMEIDELIAVDLDEHVR